MYASTIYIHVHIIHSRQYMKTHTNSRGDIKVIIAMVKQ